VGTAAGTMGTDEKLKKYNHQMLANYSFCSFIFIFFIFQFDETPATGTGAGTGVAIITPGAASACKAKSDAAWEEGRELFGRGLDPARD
jgi:hypothetical protein